MIHMCVRMFSTAGYLYNTPNKAWVHTRDLTTFTQKFYRKGIAFICKGKFRIHTYDEICLQGDCQNALD